MSRRIAHLDMDAFYASVELLRYPELRGYPLVIGGRRTSVTSDARFPRLKHYAGRGVVTTATYEARALGVHSAMGLMKAARLAPEAVLLPADFDRYRYYSHLFKTAVSCIAPHIEDRGIDEIYIDLTALHEDAHAIARRLQQCVLEATGLTCSIGIAPNKLLAKMASELDKPNGITVLTPADIADRIWPLPARSINGVGPKAATKLSGLNITTVGDLAQADPVTLQTVFGERYARWLRQAAHGHDDKPVVTHREPKSVSRETTFERDLDPRQDRQQLSEILLALCERVSADLRRKSCTGRTIGIKLRFADFTTVTRDITLTEPTAETESIRAGARACLKRVVLDRRLRLLGVRVATLTTIPQADS